MTETASPLVAFSPPTLSLFAELLNNYSLPAGHQQFEELAAVIGQARRELAGAIQAAGMVNSPPAGPEANGAGGDDLDAITADVELTPNRASRRAAAKSNGRATPKKATKKAAKKAPARSTAKKR